MLKEYETIICSSPADGVAQITLNRPGHGNGVVPEMARDLNDALNLLDADKRYRVLVLTGAGKQFCAGADLRAFKHYIENDLAVVQEAFNARVLFPVTQRLAAFRMPIVCAINGAATAGGLDMTLACDIRIASAAAKMGETYIKLGLNPGNGGTYFLPRLVGSGMAAELALTGDIIDAERALDIGLVNRVVPPDALMEEALKMASKIARHPRLASEATRQQLRHSWHMDLSASLNMSFWGASTLTFSRELKENIDATLDEIESRKK